MKKITLIGNPLSTQHLYFHRGHSVYMSREGKERKETYQWEMKSQYKGKPLQGAICVTVDLYFDSRRKHDVDNYNKLVLDAGSGILWDDDEQIWDLRIRKWYDKKQPRVELTVETDD
jgi:Holliday junction resolvase RusA-like endonuclease